MENHNVNREMLKEFKEFQEKQHELADILSSASVVTQKLNMSKEKDLNELSTKVRSDSFKVMVTGTFKNGKSTFINALLGEEILPAYAVPTTAVINEIKYGAEKRAILYFRDPLPDTLPDGIPQKTLQHMNKYKGKAIPPMDIPYDEIEDYVVIPIGADAKQYKLESPYQKVELFYPLEVLKNGVEIIDSPGLNENQTRTEVTIGYLNNVDAIIFTMSALAIASGSEMSFIEQDLKGNGFEDVLFVVNRFDQVPPRQQDKLKQYAEMKIREVYPKSNVFFLSSLNALDGRLEGDLQLLNESGFPEMEAILTKFLTCDKGRVKLVQPAKQVRQILSSEALGKVIPQERKLLDSSLTDVTEKYNELKPQLDALNEEKSVKGSRLRDRIDRTSRKFERMAKRNIKDIALLIPEWVNEYTPNNSLGIIPTKNSVSQVVNEISEYLSDKIETYQNDWRDNVLQPEITDEAESIFADAESSFMSIFNSLDKIDLSLNGEGCLPEQPTFWGRVVGGIGGYLLGGYVGAIEGGLNGFSKNLVAHIAFRIGGVAVLYVLGALNPITLIAVIIGSGFIGRSGKKPIDTLKKEVSQQAVDQLLVGADDSAADMADSISEKLNEVASQILKSVDERINDLDKQMKSVLDKKKKGEATVAKRRTELDACQNEIQGLDDRLDKLIFSLLDA